MARATGKKGTTRARTPARTTVGAKAAGKTMASRKAPAAKPMAKGDSYVCEVCGLAVIVDEACGCGEMCEVTCCEQPMKKVRKARVAKK